MLELADWRPEDIEIQASKVSNTPLLHRPAPPPTSPLPDHPPTTTLPPPPPPPIPNLLSCHDHKGGYHPSESAQGQFPAPSGPIYTAAHLHVIDTFVYFSHSLVSIPPSPWINTLHRNGIRVLGTFIVEHDAGSTALSRLLDKGSEGEYIFATQLALIAETYGFDGWLMNIEASFPGEGFRPGELQTFLRELKSAVAELVPGGQVIWYDALTVLNQVHWQNGLTLLNAPFFSVTGGLFTNYGWRMPQLEATRLMANYMDRVPDIYTGIDCFGRGSLGDGGFGVGEALSAIRRVGTSAALFAPGWTYENFDGKDFESVDRKFWVGDGGDVESNPVKPVSHFVSEKTCGGSEFFFTNFNRGFGKGWWVNGVVSFTPHQHFLTPSRADSECLYNRKS
ncbi:Glycoside Hydrolase Family 85 protein [Tuber magnatum]|uniref:Glycoside Hydrolase Family 85 protein n=1 Tax=Tuber magnatum TaxID=42249 RepID=A0A317SQT2_9PEZI|nr:Glycoside Hydrolase Family 85 protein [Tuber magnatum]